MPEKSSKKIKKEKRKKTKIQKRKGKLITMSKKLTLGRILILTIVLSLLAACSAPVTPTLSNTVGIPTSFVSRADFDKALARIDELEKDKADLTKRVETLEKLIKAGVSVVPTSQPGTAIASSTATVAATQPGTPATTTKFSTNQIVFGKETLNVYSSIPGPNNVVTSTVAFLPTDPLIVVDDTYPWPYVENQSTGLNKGKRGYVDPSRLTTNQPTVTPTPSNTPTPTTTQSPTPSPIPSSTLTNFNFTVSYSGKTATVCLMGMKPSDLYTVKFDAVTRLTNVAPNNAGCLTFAISEELKSGTGYSVVIEPKSGGSKENFLQIP